MIKKEVLEVFEIKQDGELLVGGQGESVRFGDRVLKPVEDADYASAIAQIWNALKPSNYRISRFAVSVHNQFVEDGYMATLYEPGEERPDAVQAKLTVAKALHEDLKVMGCIQLPPSNDPWTKANDILWRQHTLPRSLDEDIYSLCQEILSQLMAVNEPYQIIHGDLGGNILFDKDLGPLVIDFSPTIAPAKYAEAIIVCDSIAWQGAALDTLNYLQPLDRYKPFVQRAIAFRVLTMAMWGKPQYDAVDKEWQAYKKIWEAIEEIN